MDDGAGPTPERLQHAGTYFTAVGRARKKHITMLDDALGKALVKQIIQPEEYSGLRRYALHWTAGGLLGHLSSIDLNHIVAFDPHALASSERQIYHRDLYHQAHDAIGIKPSFVADQVACYDSSITDVGIMLGYKSRWRGRERAIELLREAGYRLVKFWDELMRSN